MNDIATTNHITFETPECDVFNEIYKPFLELIKLSLPEEAIIYQNENNNGR